jgi:hypothetical protein
MVVSLMSLLLNIDDSGKSRSGLRPAPRGCLAPEGGRDFPDDAGIIDFGSSTRKNGRLVFPITVTQRLGSILAEIAFQICGYRSVLPAASFRGPFQPQGVLAGEPQNYPIGVKTPKTSRPAGSL